MSSIRKALTKLATMRITRSEMIKCPISEGVGRFKEKLKKTLIIPTFLHLPHLTEINLFKVLPMILSII